MALPTDDQLDFEPRTRAGRQRLMQFGALSAALWLLGLAVTVVVFLHRDVIVTALLFTAACFVVASLMLGMALVARRRREAKPPPLPDRSIGVITGK